MLSKIIFLGYVWPLYYQPACTGRDLSFGTANKRRNDRLFEIGIRLRILSAIVHIDARTQWDGLTRHLGAVI
jgi:hypothetical protein